MNIFNKAMEMIRNEGVRLEEFNNRFIILDMISGNVLDENNPSSGTQFGFELSTYETKDDIIKRLMYMKKNN